MEFVGRSVALTATHNAVERAKCEGLMQQVAMRSPGPQQSLLFSRLSALRADKQLLCKKQLDLFFFCEYLFKT
jgi:hypothetical protein